MLAIAGGKGGAGKTTVTLGLAAALARRGHSPLTVDADCDMPNLHAAAGADPSRRLGAVVEGARAGDVAAPADRLPGVAVLAGDPAVDAQRALARLAPLERPVLVDCPAGASRDVALVLDAADGALVVTTPDPQAVEDAVKTAEMAHTLGAPVRGIVANRTGEPPPGLADAVDAPAVAAVPETPGDPLAATGATAAFDRLAERLSGPSRVEDPSSPPEPSRGSTRRGDRAGQSGGREPRPSADRRTGGR